MSDVWRDFHAIGAAKERADVLAFLARRMANCAALERTQPDQAERAGVMRRQLAVLIDEIRAGMHEDAAETERAIGGEAQQQEV